MTPKSNQGFSLVTAIFLLVILGMLGSVMVTLFTAQQQSSALDVMGSRAYQASRAGIEWSTFQIAQSGVAGTAFASACQTGGAVPQPPQPLGGTLASFSVAVACSATSHIEGTATTWIYSVDSTARTSGAAPGSAGYVERKIQVTISQ